MREWLELSTTNDLIVAHVLLRVGKCSRMGLDAGPLRSGWRGDEVEKVSRREGARVPGGDRQEGTFNSSPQAQALYHRCLAQRNAKIANYDFGAAIVDLPPVVEQEFHSMCREIEMVHGKLIIVAIYFLLSILTDFQRISPGPFDANLGFMYLPLSLPFPVQWNQS